MNILSKTAKMCKFETELYVAHRRGYIFRFVYIKEMNTLSFRPDVVGVEILFSDAVTPKQISEIQSYILTRYGFDVDDTLCDDVNILIVRY
jgi:hypothetical protein